ncbi:Uncharacterized protein At5g65660 [Linum perenne]
MESPDLSSPPHVDASRPSLGFPLGTALLLIVIFSLSGIFSCCYHWDKLRSLRRRNSFSDDNQSQVWVWQDVKQKQRESLTVVMPGDQIPKFIALPCPCEPPRSETAAVKVVKPPKPPRIAVPLY